MVVDTMAIPSSSRTVVERAASALLGDLDPGDRVRLVTLGTAGRQEFGPTARHEAVRSAIGRLSFTGSDMCRTQSLAGSLASVLNWSPDTVPIIVAFSAVSHAPTGDYCPLPPAQAAFVKSAFDTAGASVFVVQVPNRFGEVTTNSGLAALGRSLGGVSVTVSADPTPEMTAILTQTAGYYRATFRLDPEERDGGAHRIELRSQREDIRLVFPKSVLASDVNVSPGLALHADGEFVRAPLRAVFLTTGPVEAPTLVSVFEAAADGSVLTDAVVGVFDVQGRLVARWTASKEDLASRPAVGAMGMTPGLYRVRLAAIDKDGQIGTLETEMDIGLTRGRGMRYSSLVVGTSDGRTLVPRLYFMTESMAAADAELFEVPADGVVTATVELARASTSDALFVGPATVMTAAGSGRRLVRAEVPIGNLDRGTYLLRLRLALNGNDAATVMRTLEKR